MLIKGVTKAGNPILYSPEESLPHAILQAIKAKNTLDMVYWIEKGSIKRDSFKSTVDKDGVWEAWAEGEVSIGKTCAKRDKFFLPKLSTFKVHYKMGKDEFGIPDIELGSESVIEFIETNPAKKVGPVPEQNSVEASFGEVVASKPK